MAVRIIWRVHSIATKLRSKIPLFLEIFYTFLKLGMSSFGGPIAHLGYFRKEFVERRKWLDEYGYADLVSLCQFLPGPASSQVGMALGLSRGGIIGAFLAWLGFTLPSAVFLILFGLEFHHFQDTFGNWLHGLKIVSVAVVAQAIWSMGKSQFTDWHKTVLIALSAGLAISFPNLWMQIAIIAAGGLSGLVFMDAPNALPGEPIMNIPRRRTGAIILSIFFGLLGVLPLLASNAGIYPVRLVDSFYRAGALVFGGGHVVLPLLHAQVVPNGWVSNSEFLAGYGAAQAVPGPLFTFAAFLGTVSSGTPSGWIGAAIALFAIFLPSFLLVTGILPFWEDLRRVDSIQRIMQGINSAVLGLLIAAFWSPVCSTAIRSGFDVALAAAAFLLLLKLPSWNVVVLTVLIAGICKF